MWQKATASNPYGNCVEVEQQPADWQKAKASQGVSNCVEARRQFAGAHFQIAVRDSKDPDGPQLHFTLDEFAAFLDGAKKGEFDHLIHFVTVAP